jgi:uncharacterized SAM-binding protein YcdF (DUF218 family)
MKRLFATAILLVFAMALGWSLLIVSIRLYSQRDERRPTDVIVVLGAAQYDGRPSPVFRARLDHAIELYRQGYAPLLIMTGGVGTGDTVSEATVGRRYAIREGVSPEDVLTERSGLRSAESMQAVARLMRQRELDSALLVSDPFHMLRLRALAFRVGIQGFSSPTRTSPISSDPSEEWRHVIRESVGLPLVLLGIPW